VLRAQLFWRKQIEVGKRRFFPSIGNRCLATALLWLVALQILWRTSKSRIHWVRFPTWPPLLFENELLLVGVDRFRQSTNRPRKFRYFIPFTQKH